jgi:hypothetical protein
LPENDDLFTGLSSLPKNNEGVIFEVALGSVLPDDGG